MANIGENYTLYVAPITLYYDAQSAATRSLSGSGVWNQTGSYKVANKYWVDAQGNASPTDTGGIAIYAITHAQGYVLGWIRDDDNLQSSQITNRDGEMMTTNSTKFTISRISEDLTHKVIIRLDGKTFKTFMIVQTEFTVSFTIAERNEIYKATKNSTSKTLQFVLETYQGDKFIGPTRTYNYNVGIPDSIRPSFITSPSYTIINAVNDMAYANLSQIRVNQGESVAGAGAELSKVETRIDNETTTVSPYTMTPTKEGSLPILVTATDTRGRITTWGANIIVKGYTKPSIDEFTAMRHITQTSMAIITLRGTYNNAVSSAPQYAISIKETDTTAWGTPIITGTAETDGNLWAYSGLIPVGDPTKAFDARLEIADDKGGVATAFAYISTEDLPLTLGKYGIGVGLVADDSGANIQAGKLGISSEGPITINGESILDLMQTSTPGKVTEIPQGANINTYQNPGEYFMTDVDGNFKNNVANAPDTHRFYLKIFKNNNDAITYHVYMSRFNNTTYGLYYRTANNNSFSPWVSLLPNSGSNTNGSWVKYVDGTIIAQRTVEVEYTHGQTIPTVFPNAYNMPVEMPSNTSVYMGLTSIYTPNSEAELDLFDNFSLLELVKVGNTWIVRPTFYARWGSGSTGRINSTLYNTTPGTKYKMKITFTAIGKT